MWLVGKGNRPHILYSDTCPVIAKTSWVFFSKQVKGRGWVYIRPLIWLKTGGKMSFQWHKRSFRSNADERPPPPPTRLPVICSPFHEWQDDRQERAAVWVSMCVFNAYVWGERIEGSFLLLYKRRQQLLSVVFSLFLWPAGREQNIQMRDEPSLQIPNTAMIACPVCIYIVLLNSTMWKNQVSPWELGSGRVSLATKCMTVVRPGGNFRASDKQFIFDHHYSATRSYL